MGRLLAGSVLALALLAPHRPVHATSERTLLDTPLARLPGQRLTAITVRYPPAGASRPHRHPGAVFVYVLAGRVRSALAGQPVHVYRAGESWYEPPGSLHRTSANASATEPARMLVVFVTAEGAPLSQPARGASGD